MKVFLPLTLVLPGVASDRYFGSWNGFILLHLSWCIFSKFSPESVVTIFIWCLVLRGRKARADWGQEDEGEGGGDLGEGGVKDSQVWYWNSTTMLFMKWYTAEDWGRHRWRLFISKKSDANHEHWIVCALHCKKKTLEVFPNIFGFPRILRS